MNETEQETLPAQLELSTEVEKFNGLNARIAEFKQRAGIVPDMSTPEGEKETRSIRAEGKSLKNEVEEKRLSIYRITDTFNKSLRVLGGSLQDQVAKMYAPHDEAIKAKEEVARAKAEEKLRAKEEYERKEKERTDLIQSNITKIRELPLNAVNMTPEAIDKMLSECAEPTDEYFQEFLLMAKAAYMTATTSAEGVRDQKLEVIRIAEEQAIKDEKIRRQQEELDAKIRRQQEELDAKIAAHKERKAKEQAKVDERKRIADESEQQRLDDLKRREDELSVKEQKAKEDELAKQEEERRAEELRLNEERIAKEEANRKAEQAELDWIREEEAKKDELSYDPMKACEDGLKKCRSEFGGELSVIQSIQANMIPHLRWSDTP